MKGLGFGLELWVLASSYKRYYNQEENMILLCTGLKYPITNSTRVSGV